MVVAVGDEPEITEVDEFEEDLKKLEHHCRSIREDLKRVKKLLRVRARNYADAPRVSFSEVKIDSKFEVYKLKRFHCKSLGVGSNKNGIRVMYGYDVERNVLILEEIYRKKRHSDDCNLSRLNKYFGEQAK